MARKRKYTTRRRSGASYSSYRKPRRRSSYTKRTTRARPQVVRIEVVQAAPTSVDGLVPNRVAQMRSNRSRF